MLFDLAAAHRTGQPVALTAICSAHPLVLKATLRHAHKHHLPVLIEATCNQVNHQGGYTGMQPADFVALVERLVDEGGFDRSRLILGGDHLGPNPWRALTAAEAMLQAEKMVAEYAAAGFTKFHLDASMPCADDPNQLNDDTVAQRAARMAAVVERICALPGKPRPAYIIGTEVPPPGGATHELDNVTPTDPAAALQTVAVHRRVFSEAGLEAAFERVVGLVVQPGVEFGDVNVVQYDAENAAGLAAVLEAEPGICFEAHSTDYQHTDSLRQLVRDGYGILKVGPWLTFAMREALYGLDAIASELSEDYPVHALHSAMDAAMLSDISHWQDHYRGTEIEQRLKRHFSYSDRIRYYWNTTVARQALDRLEQALSGRRIPQTLISQHLPMQWRDAMRVDVSWELLILNAIEAALAQYPHHSLSAAA